MSSVKEKKETPNPMRHWRGLGGWNFYFWLKFALLWYGVLNFHPLANLVFLACLLFPLPSIKLHRIRNWIAIPFGLALFYYDTWLPGLSSIMSQGGNLVDFDRYYLLELIQRFINWQMVGIGFVLLVAYLFISEWVRVTLFTILILIWLNITAFIANHAPVEPMTNTTKSTAPVKNAASDLNTSLAPTTTNLNSYLNEFYIRETSRKTKFPKELPADAQPFDILIIQICSLAWADLYASALDKHPIWGRFDLVFTQFNSAASYSGPAAIRLLRASCGQQKHADLYKPTSSECYLFSNLAKLGFKNELMMDHDGEFGGFLDELSTDGDLHARLMKNEDFKSDLIAFNNHPIFDDSKLLNNWLDKLKNSDVTRSATFFNVITLHDGTRIVGQNTSASYKQKGQELFDGVDHFFKNLEQSGRKVMVVFVPEHGMNLSGDKLQMSGLRDLPSPTITHVPVGVKFIGMKAPYPGSPIDIDTPTSYLALSDLIARVIDGKIFDMPTVDWQSLVRGLPETAIVSENEGIVVINYQGKNYIRLSGESNWTPYPK